MSAPVRRGFLIDESGVRVGGTVLADRFETDLVIFPNLLPGDYTLSSLVAYYELSDAENKEHYDCELDPPRVMSCTEAVELHFVPSASRSDEFRFTLELGEPRYFGMLTLIADEGPPYRKSGSGIDRHKTKMDEDTCEIAYTPRGEFEALKRIKNEYIDGPWMDRCRDRMAELKQVHAETKTDSSRNEVDAP